jgi:hypothetical protein
MSKIHLNLIYNVTKSKKSRDLNYVLNALLVPLQYVLLFSKFYIYCDLILHCYVPKILHTVCCRETRESMRQFVLISHENRRAESTVAHYLKIILRPSYRMKNTSFGAGLAD